MLKINKLKVRIEIFGKPMLGTNPSNPNVMDMHIIDRQRKLIAEHSSINKAINKYLDAKTISKERQEQELEGLRKRIEEVIGEPLSDDEFAQLRAGDFKKFSDLKETMAELDEKGITCFFRAPDEKGEMKIAIGSHMILGFLKAAAEAIIRTKTQKNGTIMKSSAYTASILNQHVSIEEDFIIASKDIVRTPEGAPSYLQRSLRAMTAQGPRVSLAKSEQLPTGTQFEFTISVLDNSPLELEHLQELLDYGVLKGLGQWRNAGYGRFKVLELK